MNDVGEHTIYIHAVNDVWEECSERRNKTEILRTFFKDRKEERKKNGENLNRVGTLVGTNANWCVESGCCKATSELIGFSFFYWISRSRN